MIMDSSIINLFEVNIFKSKSTLLLEGGFRLNADYYSHDNHFCLPNKIPTSKLSDLAKVIGFGPFKRYYIDDLKYGIPLISSSEMMELNPTYEGIISKEFTKDIDKYIVFRNTILVSCSGTIGNVTIVDSRLEGMALSQHSLRVIPKNIEVTGLIYTFLSSVYGKSLISGKKSGAVIDEIYEDDLNGIDVPILPQKYILEINKLIFQAYSNRDIANDLLKKSQALVLKYNNLPLLDRIEKETLDPENGVDIRLVNTSEFTDEYRIDAHFYNPIADLAVKNIKSASKGYQNLFEVADCTFRGGRSIRNYVGKEHGTPFLSGKNIIQIRPDLKYISNTETGNLNEMLVEKNWILITRSGTLGRTVFVWKNYEGFAASEHLIRVVPFENSIDQGYLYAFLSSDYGYHQLLRYKHGSVIYEITEDQISKALIPLPNNNYQKEIGNIVRQAYDLRAEAIRLEDKAQETLTQALTTA